MAKQAIAGVRKVMIRIKGISPYSQGKKMQSERGPNELHDAHDERCWRERMHVGKDGTVYIPPMSFKNALVTAASRLAIKVAGKGQRTYKSLFDSGIMCTEPMDIGVKAAEAVNEKLFVPSDGKKGGGSRVDKRFPLFSEWGGQTEIVVLDDQITEAIFQKHLEHAGVFVGLGRFRPEHGGFYGRFTVASIKWENMS